MRNDFRVVIRVQHHDVFDQMVDAPDAKGALEQAMKEVLTRDLSGVKGSLDLHKPEGWKMQR